MTARVIHSDPSWGPIEPPCLRCGRGECDVHCGDCKRALGWIRTLREGVVRCAECSARAGILQAVGVPR